MATRTSSVDCACGGPHLTFREMQVLRLAAGGLSSAQIGRRLKIGKHTVDDYFSSALHRCRARSRTEAIARAYAAGIFMPGEWPPQWSGQSCLVRDVDLRPACPDADSELLPGRPESQESSARPGPGIDEVTVRVGFLRLRRGDGGRRARRFSEPTGCPITVLADARGDVHPARLRETLDLSIGEAVVVPGPDRIALVIRQLMELIQLEVNQRHARADAIPGICIELLAQHPDEGAGETLIFAALPKGLRA